MLCLGGNVSRANPTQSNPASEAVASQSVAQQIPGATIPETAGIPATAPVPAAHPAPADPLGRSTPHGAVLGFLRAAEAKDYSKASDYLDGKRARAQGEELAEQLKYLLDRGLSSSIDDLSRSPDGNLEDEHRLSRDSVGTVKTPSGDLKVILDRVERPGQPAIWLFSQETLREVPAAYESLQLPTTTFFPSMDGAGSFPLRAAVAMDSCPA